MDVIHPNTNELHSASWNIYTGQSSQPNGMMGEDDVDLRFNSK